MTLLSKANFNMFHDGTASADETRCPDPVSAPARQPFTPSPEQAVAIDLIAAWYAAPRAGQCPFFLAGFAGSGKSSTIPAIINRLGVHPAEVAMCASTNKAADVVRGKFGDMGVRVTTLHSAFLKPTPDPRLHRLQVQYEDAISKAAPDSMLRMLRQSIAALTLDFTLGGGNHAFKLIIVEECSMIGQKTWATTQIAQLGIPVLAIGDPAQLPPPKDAPQFITPNTTLQTIHRQAGDSDIAELARRVRIDPGYYRVGAADAGDGVHIIDHQSAAGQALMAAHDVQHLTYSNQSRHQITKACRAALGYHDPHPRLGESLVVEKKAALASAPRKKRKFVNGDVFEVRHCEQFTMHLPTSLDHGEAPRIMLTDGDATVHVPCYADYLNAPYSNDLRDYQERLASGPGAAANPAALSLSYAYALTVHKAQGSEWDAVIVHEYDRRRCIGRCPTRASADDARAWLYTAITRAKQTLIVLI